MAERSGNPGRPKKRPGPKRASGAPVGPEEVRRAVLDAAADLFARKGVAKASLRAIARAADVQPTLIRRYIGTREELIDAVLEDLGATVAQELVDRPLEQLSFERDSTMGRWTALLTYLASSGDLHDRATGSFNPVDALARVIMENYHLGPTAARLRGAQIVASGLGWRIFEEYLVEMGDFEEIGLEALRDELTSTHRRIGATDWPSPPDPPSRRR